MGARPGTRCADSWLSPGSAVLMLLDRAGRGAWRQAAVCMERSGCSPFPVCWAEGINALGVSGAYVDLQAHFAPERQRRVSQNLVQIDGQLNLGGSDR